MELLQLKYFQTVAYTEHISKAAEQLKISQPSLSITIKRLEDELGVVLFERKGRNIRLSTAGKIFINHVNRIFLEIDNARMEIDSHEQDVSKTVKISISNTRFLTGLISEYIHQYPETKIQQGLGEKDSILTSLKKGDIDLGIVGQPSQDEEIESCVIMNEDIVLALPSTHRHVGKSQIPLAEVADESFISLANNEEYRQFTTQLCKNEGFMPNNTFEVDSQLLAEIIRLDQGVALLPISVCKSMKLNYVTIDDISPTYTVALSWVKHKTLTSAAINFRDFIISYFKDNFDLYKV